MWRSVPQIPVLRTPIRTSLMPIAGSGTFSRLSPGPGAVLTNASITVVCRLARSGAVSVDDSGRDLTGDPQAVASRTPSRGPGAPSVVVRVLGPIDDRVLHGADPVDLAADPIARLEEDRRVAKHADPGRGARRDDVARVEGDVAADERDQLRDREGHVGGRAVLHRLCLAGAGSARAWDSPAAKSDADGRIELVRCNENRAHRQERVAALGSEPLAIALSIGTRRAARPMTTPSSTSRSRAWVPSGRTISSPSAMTVLANLAKSSGHSGASRP